MELKLRHRCRLSLVFVLLIVPYGIETLTGRILRLHLRTLLIVPYGIETSKAPQKGKEIISLLIVPYGIETFYTFLCAHTNDNF